MPAAGQQELLTQTARIHYELDFGYQQQQRRQQRRSMKSEQPNKRREQQDVRLVVVVVIIIGLRLRPVVPLLLLKGSG